MREERLFAAGRAFSSKTFAPNKSKIAVLEYCSMAIILPYCSSQISRKHWHHPTYDSMDTVLHK